MLFLSPLDDTFPDLCARYGKSGIFQGNDASLISGEGLESGVEVQ
jgi:hypothetical protein